MYNYCLKLEGTGGLRGCIGAERNNHSAKRFAGNEAYLHFYLSNFTDAQSLRNAVRSIGYCGGNTHATGGLRRTRTEIFNVDNGDRSGVPDVIVFISDGNPTLEVEFLAAEARLIKRRNIRIVGVGVTNKVSECTVPRLFSVCSQFIAESSQLYTSKIAKCCDTYILRSNTPPL